jgi:HK97 gp10 family phage protein
MANVNIQITNIDAIRRAFRAAPDKMEKALNTAIQKVLFAIQAETIRNVHPNRGINVITGGLLSATERPPVFTRLKGVYDIDIKYAIFVHDGTRFMRARPFLQNAVDSQKEITDRFFTEAVDSVLSEIGKETQ